ncbi:MAG: hypothetical protein LUH05_03295 [Candidatus Gastranaerophilales bacterium]|nr:hypothetical protein [Candidatus Gastranaerophilales bacterium]
MKKSEFNYPIIDEELLKRLKEDFPDTIPRTHKSEFEYGVLAGIQKVIDKLQFEYKEQTESEH